VGYGLFALVSRLVIWIEWLSTAGITGTTIKFIGEASDWRPIGTTVIRLHLLLGLGIGGLLWLLSSPLSYLFNEPVMVEYLKLFAIEIPIYSLACANSSILVGTRRFKERARVSAARWITRLILIVLLVEMGLDVTGAIMGMIGASTVELILSSYYVRPSFFSKTIFPIKRLLGFGVPLFMSTLSLRIFRMDLFALKILGGTAAQAGYYGAALNLSIPPTLFSASLSPPLLATLSRLLSEKEEPGAKEIGLTAIRSIFWLLPFAAMTAGTASEIVQFIYGQKYLAASNILPYLIFASIGLLSINISKSILTALGRPGWTFLLAGPMVPLALIGHLILIPWLGSVGAAIVTTLIACLGAIACVSSVCLIWALAPPIKTILKSILISGLAYVLAILWPVSGFMLIIKIMVIMFCIVLSFLLFREFSPKEIALLRSMNQK